MFDRLTNALRRPPSVRLLLAVFAAVLSTVWTVDAATAQSGGSGLPVPRFVSLKSDHINVRVGPGRDYRVAWVFARAGLPVEITAESGNWRRIRDSDGDEGWIFHSLLSGRRTALVAPWSNAETVAMKRSADGTASDAALAEPGVLVDVDACNGRWCRVSAQDVTGWVPQDRLWGVYPDEVLD